ncbi:hypothetical protein [Aeromonas caviae]|uniref:hypothetical protein n=1 Tax=Aeromonas caviae TaxID=648 RepID=UPI002250CC19|nr:hypothetical protein [Aeromonas caviae]MCX4071931.1 hypothetical protein [Aeromonas caviae]
MRDFKMSFDEVDDLTDYQIRLLAAFGRKEPSVDSSMPFYMGQFMSLVNQVGCKGKSKLGPDEFVPWLNQEMPERLLTPEEKKAKHEKAMSDLIDLFEELEQKKPDIE